MLSIIPSREHTVAPAISWWERRRTILAALLIGLIPLVWPALPPLTDLPGHMGRWHIASAIGRSATLSRYYDYAWSPVGNLGMDLLVPVIAAVLPFEAAAKIGVMLIILLTMTGSLWTAREIHGRVPPTALLALPFAYAWPFQFGFVNFALAQALAFCAFALWIRLGNQQRLTFRAATFVPISCSLWIAHTFGWGMFGLMAAAAELARLRAADRPWRYALPAVAVQMLPLALPLWLMAMLSNGTPANPLDWFNWQVKAWWIVSMLRDRWQIFDSLSISVIILTLYIAGRSPRLGYSAQAGWPAILCAATFVLLPRLALGGSYVDMRMAPATIMLALIAVRPPSGSTRFAQRLAMIAMSFFLVRTAATTASYVIRSYEQEQELAAIAAIPYGAAVLSLIARPCNTDWSDARRDHLPGIAIVRRDIFTNEQWALDGQQLLRIRHVVAQPYLTDPSQLVYPTTCAEFGSRLGAAIRTFPRDAFTHVWTIGFGPGAAHASDLAPIWTNGKSTLYRVR